MKYRYIVDFDKVNALVTIPPIEGKLTETETTTTDDKNTVVVTREFERAATLDGTKYEMINKLLDILLLSEAKVANNVETMLDDTYFGYKLAFETLEDLGIIKYIED